MAYDNVSKVSKGYGGDHSVVGFGINHDSPINLQARDLAYGPGAKVERFATRDASDLSFTNGTGQAAFSAERTPPYSTGSTNYYSTAQLEPGEARTPIPPGLSKQSDLTLSPQYQFRV